MIENFQFVKVTEECTKAFEIPGIGIGIKLELEYGIYNMDIMSFFCSICDSGEVSIQDRVTNHHQLHDKILGCLS